MFLTDSIKKFIENVVDRIMDARMINIHWFIVLSRSMINVMVTKMNVVVSIISNPDIFVLGR